MAMDSNENGKKAAEDAAQAGNGLWAIIARIIIGPKGPFKLST